MVPGRLLHHLLVQLVLGEGHGAQGADPQRQRDAHLRQPHTARGGRGGGTGQQQLCVGEGGEVMGGVMGSLGGDMGGI